MSNAQEITRDSTLAEIVVEAYSADRPPDRVPVSVTYLSNQELSRFNNSSLLPAVNNIPGVRMEERSPGSYRFSIRGSSLRSPFGIRNVKIYWNGMPLTDGGGNTYLNLLDVENIGSAEVIKGPGGSLYGAGTGGVVLLKSPRVKDDRIVLSALGAGYGMQRYSLTGTVHSDKTTARAGFARQQSEGYRDQSEMERNAVNLNLDHAFNSKNSISASIFYTDVFYETPGGLTLALFEADPAQARPAGGPFPSAEDQKAAVTNKTLFAGISHHHDWNQRSYTSSSVYGSFVDFQNPSIREYEIRDETNIGLRSVTKYFISERVNLAGGGEYQFLDSPIKKYENNGGQRGDKTNDDVLVSTLGSLFAQSEFDAGAHWLITVGLSANFAAVSFDSSFPAEVAEERTFKPFFSPRLAVLKSFKTFSAYASFSNGFSPPTIADLYPSTAEFDQSLEAEHGNNFEAGLKGKMFSDKVYFSVTGYEFRIRNTIVPRRDEADAEYFVNAGETEQRGLEISMDYLVVRDAEQFITDLKVSSGYAYHHYRFKDYIQATNQGTLDHSGNKLTGVPPTTAFLTFDIMTRRGPYINFTTNYVDHIPLNDANTAYAEAYVLISARIGYKNLLKSGNVLEIFTGVENAANEVYSLGNDLNAAAGRYYNAAAPRNYYAGVRFDLIFKR